MSRTMTEQERYAELRADYLSEFQPANRVEFDLVIELVTNQWQMRYGSRPVASREYHRALRVLRQIQAERRRVAKRRNNVIPIGLRMPPLPLPLEPEQDMPLTPSDAPPGHAA